MTPNVENIRKWVEALRSGKYAQATATLRDAHRDAYCCLGVACEVSRLGRWWSGQDLDAGYDAPPDRPAYRTANGADSGELPEDVASWLGLHKNPRFAVVGDDDGVYATVANDTYEWTFAEIADAIERTYLTPEVRA